VEDEGWKGVCGLEVIQLSEDGQDGYVSILFMILTYVDDRRKGNTYEIIVLNLAAEVSFGGNESVEK
jgi:hypothetical protein